MKFTIENDHIKGGLGYDEIFISTNGTLGFLSTFYCNEEKSFHLFKLGGQNT